MKKLMLLYVTMVFANENLQKEIERLSATNFSQYWPYIQNQLDTRSSQMIIKPLEIQKAIIAHQKNNVSTLKMLSKNTVKSAGVGALISLPIVIGGIGIGSGLESVARNDKSDNPAGIGLTVLGIMVAGGSMVVVPAAVGIGATAGFARGLVQVMNKNRFNNNVVNAVETIEQYLKTRKP